MSSVMITRPGLALGANHEDNGDVNAQPDTYVVGTKVTVTGTDAGPQGSANG